MDDIHLIARETLPAPRVSVIIPVFNDSAHIRATLESVLAQTQPAAEIIVVNDGSDDTRELEATLKQFAQQIIYLKQDNAGPSSARNSGIAKASGAYLAFLDSDDLWEPNYLADQIRALQKDPKLDLVYADALLVGDSVPAGLTFMQAAPSNGLVTFEGLLRGDCSVITSCVLVRKSAVEEVGLFDSEFFRSEDLDLWLRLAHSGHQLSYHRALNAQHRVRDGSLSADATVLFLSKIAVLEKLFRKLTLTKEQRRLVEQEIERCRADIAFHEGKQQFISGRYAAAVAAFSAANRFYRSNRLRAVLFGLRIAPGFLRWAHQRRYEV